jgi:Tfp pilus assembly protein FimT
MLTNQFSLVQPTADQSGRCGFTLFELLLVLGIFVTIGAIAIPSLDRMMERHRLRNAADEMRLVWDDTRLKAMSSGQAQVFQCQVGSNTYTLKPLMQAEDVNNVGDGATIMMGGAALSTDSDSGMPLASSSAQQASKSIDESLKFSKCIVASDYRTYDLAQSGQSMDINIATVNQSVVFYPDGTTSSAELRIIDPKGDSVGLQIRGLTGHTKLLALEAGAIGSGATP